MNKRFTVGMLITMHIIRLIALITVAARPQLPHWVNLSVITCIHAHTLSEMIRICFKLVDGISYRETAIDYL